MLTTKETLALLGVARSTLHAMIKRGDITPVRPRKVVRKQPNLFRRADVEALLKPRASG